MKIEYYTKYYIQNSDHYLIPKDVFIELFNEMESWKQDTNKYKEVIDKAKFAIKTNCIKNGNKYEEICCNGDYLLQILEDKEV